MGSIVPSAWRVGLGVAALLASGCAGSRAHVAQSPAHHDEPVGVTNAQPGSPASGALWTVFLSADILEACGMPASDGSFRFDPDRPQDVPARAALRRLSSCVRGGPLTGRMLRVVGQAQPIATQPQDGEKIGLWRAEGVRRTLALYGIAASAVAGSPPDVTAQDDTGVAYARRVDVELAP